MNTIKSTGKRARVGSMRSLLKRGATTVILAGLSFSARADEQLVRERNCMACHAVSKKLVGPSFASIAERYASEPRAERIVAASMMDGSSGKWGSTSMPAQSNMSESDAQKLARWILSLRPASPSN